MTGAEDLAEEVAALAARLEMLEAAQDDAPASPVSAGDAATPPEGRGTATNQDEPHLVWPPLPLSSLAGWGWGDCADQDAWGALVTWVDWFYATYRLRTPIPPCWPDHPAAVEELASLWMAWCDAAAKSRAEGGDALAYWHDRYLAGFNARWHEYAIHNCEGVTHQPERAPKETDTSLVSIRETAVSTPGADDVQGDATQPESTGPDVPGQGG